MEADYLRIIHLSKDLSKTLNTLKTLLGNILNNPDNEKYREVRINNHQINKYIIAVNGCVEFLYKLGFERHYFPSKDNGPLEGYLVLCNLKHKSLQKAFKLLDTPFNKNNTIIRVQTRKGLLKGSFLKTETIEDIINWVTRINEYNIEINLCQFSNPELPLPKTDKISYYKYTKFIEIPEEDTTNSINNDNNELENHKKEIEKFKKDKNIRKKERLEEAKNRIKTLENFKKDRK